MFKSIRVSPRAPRMALAVAAVYADDLTLPPKLPKIDRQGRIALQQALTTPGFKGEAGETAFGDPQHMVLGLGKKAELNADQLRNIGGRLLKRLDRIAPGAASLIVAETVPAATLDSRTVGRAIGEGMGLANWRVDFFAGSATKNKPPHPALELSGATESFRKGLQYGLRLAESANYARQLAATPPNICNPGWMATEARRLARSHRLRCTVIDFNRAKRMGMGGIVSVGMGSKAKPCLIVLEHKPARVASRARGITLALVGKTITYDTGGYSLKINNTMKGMKYDKSGGMAVIGAMRAIAAMKLPVRVVGLLPCAENMVSDDAYRPDDIIAMYNKVSVEVTNTDAEGRLVLADALTYACRDVEATHIIDLATLTGGIVTALGHFCSGVFCNDDKLLARVQAAAESSGEKTWRMPLWKDHKEFMRAQHADILNSNPSRNAHPIQGAAFLAYFVEESVPWAHIDIAGVAAVEKDTDLFVTGPTGYGVRLLVELVQSWA